VQTLVSVLISALLNDNRLQFVTSFCQILHITQKCDSSKSGVADRKQKYISHFRGVQSFQAVIVFFNISRFFIEYKLNNIDFVLRGQ